MMSCKLAMKNIRKSLRDYTIYFLTLVLGVAIFYMFNSLDSQEAMMTVSSSTREIVKLMITMLSMVSVFVAAVLGFLIVYANNFLIKRRKKEFGLYMTLGMGKWQISKILLMETFFVGLFSLGVGLVIGVFGSQFMSVLVVKLFEADMSEFTFVFSKVACLKTCLYFGIMYVAVMLFNAVTVSKYKLIDLLTAGKKNESVKMKNAVLCVVVFLAACVILGRAYYQVTGGVAELDSEEKLIKPILMGIVSTYLIFWSLSGFVLKLVQMKKSMYLRGTNVFVLRQIHSKINTTLVSMTVICLLLFMTISVLSSALSLNRYLTKDLQEMTPVDLNLYKTANLPDNGDYTEIQIEDSRRPISATLKENGLDMSVLKDMEEIVVYADNQLTWGTFLGNIREEVEKQFPMLNYDTAMELVHISDYNKIAKAYGIAEYDLEDDEYLVLCDFDNMKKLWDLALKTDQAIMLSGQKYTPGYQECQDGYIVMATSHINTGILLVPDSCVLPEESRERYLLIANYNAESDKEKQKIEDMFTNYGEDSRLIENLEEKGIKVDGVSKIALLESSKGLSTIVTFIAIYLGIIFLIASSAILALKELSETSDNMQRYEVLRKIGVDEKMLHQTLFRQIGIFFLMPLVLAVIHSVFGIQFALKILSLEIKTEEILPSVIATAIFLILIYGGYFLATYAGSKNIIKEVP